MPYENSFASEDGKGESEPYVSIRHGTNAQNTIVATALFFEINTRGIVDTSISLISVHGSWVVVTCLPAESEAYHSLEIIPTLTQFSLTIILKCLS